MESPDYLVRAGFASDFQPEFKRFGGLFLAWAVGFLGFALDRSRAFPALTPGLLTGFLECSLEAAIILNLFSRRKEKAGEYRYFLWFFCLILPADISYLSLHYLFKDNHENWTSFFLTTLPYTAAYLIGAVGFFQHLRPLMRDFRDKPWKLLKILWLPALLAVPAICGVFLPLLRARYAAAGLSFDFLEIALNSLFSILFFFWSCAALMISPEPVFSLAGLAGIISQLGNWGGISAYLVHQNSFVFGEYEFLWLCGIIAFWYAFSVVGNFAPWPDSEERSAVLSLASRQKMTILSLISAFLIGAALILSHGPNSYRIVLFGVALGAALAAFAGELLARQIIRYSLMFGQLVHIADENDFLLNARVMPMELRQIYRAAFQEDATRRRREEAIQRSLADLSSQVAHDIRSPLAALDSVMADASRLPEEKRLIIRGAIGRIRDIANHLLDERRQVMDTRIYGSSGASEVFDEPAALCLLSSLIEPLITEKRLQYRSRLGLEIEARMDRSSYGLFALVQPVEFKRVLSNLIDNAVEAMREPGNGQVQVNLSKQGDFVALEITDNGAGIAPDILPRLCRKGASFGKLKGSGLGLHHAKAAVESWGGQLTLTSGNVVTGSDFGASAQTPRTSVTLEIPQAPAPDWFISELWIYPGEDIVILDDDASIHQVWRERLEFSRRQEKTPRVFHFSTPHEIKSWAGQNPQSAQKAVYLVDYELLGHKETGLELVEELGVCERAILVTSRFDEPGILEECRRLGVRMIPKSFAGMVPLRLSESPEPFWDAVLIDDDPLVRMTWKLAANRAGKKLLSFPSASEFLRAVSGINRSTPVYIDQELGGKVNGIEVSFRIAEFGFTELYLATGRKGLPRGGLKHLKGAVGKDPPSGWAPPPWTFERAPEPVLSMV